MCRSPPSWPARRPCSARRGPECCAGPAGSCRRPRTPAGTCRHRCRGRNRPGRRPWWCRPRRCRGGCSRSGGCGNRRPGRAPSRRARRASRSVCGVTDSENRGTTATCSSAVAGSPVSAACHFSISSLVSRMASSSLVISAAAESGPTVWMPRPLTIRSPRRWVSANSASCAWGNADPKTTAAVVPAAIRRSQKSTAAAPGEIRIGETGFGREDARVEPFEQLPAAVRVAAVGLREMHVGVDESGEQKPGTVVDHLDPTRSTAAPRTDPQ